MAYFVDTFDSPDRTKRTYICDYRSDVPKLPTVHHKGIGAGAENNGIEHLPCSPGSKCICLEDGSVWILGMETHRWCEV